MAVALPFEAVAGVLAFGMLLGIGLAVSWRMWRSLPALVPANRHAELERSNALLASIYATAPVGLILLDCDLRIAMVNDYWTNMTRLSAQDAIGRTLPELFGRLGEQYQQPFREVRDSGVPQPAVEVTTSVPTVPDTEQHLIVGYHPVVGIDGRLVGVSAVLLDVSERHALAERLRDANEQFRALHEMSGDAHMLIAYGAGFVGGNGAAARIFGCAGVEELLTLSPATTSPEFQPDGQRSDLKAEQLIRHALETGSHHFEWLHQRRDGSLFHADVLLISLDIGGKGILQATVRDISERVAADQAMRATSEHLERSEARLRSLNEQLLQALEQAELASSAKTEFLANMSHEIRTPMNAIMGLARLLEESPLARRERDYVAKMAMAARSLLGIINDVLDFSRIEAGQLQLEYTPFTLEQVLRSIAVLVGPGAASKGVELVFDVAPEVPAELHGDPMRLEQVLLNLIGNAIKFTEQGEVVLSVRMLGREEDAALLGFAVRDTGIGIASSQQATMFDAFSQGDSSTSRKFGGAGLGLAICRRLVALMDGAITVRSKPGEGSAFSFDARFGAAPDSATVAMAQATACRVLLVDDNASARAAIAAQCTAYGWQVDSVSGADDALARLRGQAAYDLLVIDSAMPGMDGISLLTTARIDARCGLLPPCAVMVAESARARLDDMAEELQLGAVIGKPVTPGALAAALTQLRGGQAQPDSAPHAVALAGRLAGLHVLLVEDNQINQEVAHYILVHAGAAVDIAANGRTAVDMLFAHPTRYDAVLMDVQMPVLNGYAATEEIRRRGLISLPIIAMTANAMEDDRVHAINAGMNGHVSKPIDVDSLVTAINRVTAGGPARELRAPAPAPVAGGAPLPAAIAGIDLAPTLQRFGGNYAKFVSLFKRFEGSHGDTLAEVRALLGAGQRQLAAPLLHKLRGVAANLGAVEVAALALQAEQDLLGGDDEALHARLARLGEALTQVLQGARALNADQSAPHASGADPAEVRAALAHLLGLLQNNNLKAMAAFDALRLSLGAVADPEQVAALADAVATLAFANAAALIETLLARSGPHLKGSA